MDQALVEHLRVIFKDELASSDCKFKIFYFIQEEEEKRVETKRENSFIHSFIEQETSIGLH